MHELILPALCVAAVNFLLHVTYATKCRVRACVCVCGCMWVCVRVCVVYRSNDYLRFTRCSNESCAAKYAINSRIVYVQPAWAEAQ